MPRLSELCALWILLSSCGASYNSKIPASSGVEDLIAALGSDNPRRAYDLLAEQVKQTISYRDFAQQWRQTAAERAWQTAALRDSLRGAPDVGERAVVGYGNGKSTTLQRDGKTWRMEAPLAVGAQTPRPRDAIRAFAEAIEQRDIGAALSLLTKERREGVARQIEGFLRGFRTRVNDAIDEYSDDRAELRWDEDGIRYRITLRREAEEWRIDDISIRLSPKDDGDLETTEE
jgi:hypothetical protein